MKVSVPPIKSQGIKTKLVPWVRQVVPEEFNGTWIEPFCGTGAVAFNIAPKRALLCDSNPHLISFYSGIADGQITPEIVNEFLTREGASLAARGEGHYYAIRERFNRDHSPLDFLFMNRAGFNGMIRFNRKGEFNIPFCRKPSRFAQAYVTKITNQVAFVSTLLKSKQFVFKCQDFTKTLEEAAPNDIVYCDPPYIGRHVDYYNGWDDAMERKLCAALSRLKAKFILSTWHHNDFRRNEYIETLWSEFDVLTKDHFYHVGGKEANRNPVVEALITNFTVAALAENTREPEQLVLVET